MLLKKWEELPSNMQNEEVRKYYLILQKKKTSLICKRIFDVCLSFILLILLLPVFLILAIAIKIDSKGPVFYRQERVTANGRIFRIFKFRTMVENADHMGTLVTVKGDARITRVGKVIRKCRLDEICQLFDVLRGTMTFVGTRPEVPKYVNAYTREMMATLLLPAGVTSKASVLFKEESKLLSMSENPDETYIHEVLPQKMYWNLKELEEFGFFEDLRIMWMTLLAVLGKDYKEDIEEKIGQVEESEVREKHG